MKLKTSLLVATLVAFAASVPVAYADHHMGAKEDATKEKKAETKKTVKKHSHAEEKSGMPMPEPDASKHDDMKKNDMHDHTKDKH